MKLTNDGRRPAITLICKTFLLGLGGRNGAMASHRNLPRSFAPVDSDDDEDCYTDPEVGQRPCTANDFCQNRNFMVKEESKSNKYLPQR